LLLSLLLLLRAPLIVLTGPLPPSLDPGIALSPIHQVRLPGKLLAFPHEHVACHLHAFALTCEAADKVRDVGRDEAVVEDILHGLILGADVVVQDYFIHGSLEDDEDDG
jgi:hypothetical protein